MHLYVPSLGRTQPHEIERGPLVRIPEQFRGVTHLVVPYGEGFTYRTAMERHGLSWVWVLETPPGMQGIGPTRHWIGQHAHRNDALKFLMMDDDIDFLVRRSPADWQLVAQDRNSTLNMLWAIDHYLDRFASVGISSREGNNRVGIGGPHDENMISVSTRVMRMFGCRTADWLEMEHGRVEVMEDFDLQLQLLRAGRGNCCLYYWANGQKMTNSPGGCSTYRTHEVQDRAARELQRLHGSDIVKLREKRNKTDAEGLGTRTEVTIGWKRAAALARA